MGLVVDVGMGYVWKCRYFNMGMCGEMGSVGVL